MGHRRDRRARLRRGADDRLSLHGSEEPVLEPLLRENRIQTALHVAAFPSASWISSAEIRKAPPEAAPCIPAKRKESGSGLRLRRRSLRPSAAVVHELIEFGLVLGVAQPGQELQEIALLVVE